MGSLLKMDLTVLKHDRTTVFMGLMFLASLIGNETLIYMDAVVALIPFKFMITLMAYEEKFNTDRVTMSLPVEKSEFVKNKFQLMLLTTVFMMSILLPVKTILTLIGYLDVPLMDTFGRLMMISGFALVLVGIGLPLMIRDGYLSSNRKLTLIQVTPMVLFWSFHEDLTNPVAGVLIILGALMFYKISYQISLKLFMEREKTSWIN